ncbi:P-loop containing nucleoside triphosphate hydrolase protein [Mycena maculata]|uniref:DNA 3'-5' helicase n=1 Tax=Mycena maculata TaxID=230809 RepID=A0AAD7MTF6_9AGAR|nr:P-loop containing nucleoside triphosphate hydrolase protein [Mycena maculata]
MGPREYTGTVRIRTTRRPSAKTRLPSRLHPEMAPVASKFAFSSPSTPPRLSHLEIRARALKHLGYQPCLWQIRVVEAILKRDGDVVCIAATGSGKTLTFWLPLLFNSIGIQLVVSPLNILGEQNVQQLATMGLKGISITADTANTDNFRDIEEGKYCVVVTNVKTLMQQDGGFSKLWKKAEFTRRLIRTRPTAPPLPYPRDIPFVLVSATLPPAVLSDVMNVLQVSPKKVEIIRRSNDRANIHLVVREMKYAMNSFMYLAFLIPDNWQPGDPLPPKFLIFFDSIADSVAAANFLRNRLPLEHRNKIKWFNSEMSPQLKVDESDSLKAGVTWGLNCTDSFGMGLDLPDVLLIEQWRSTCDTCTLWQRIGRAARALHLTAKALFLVEPKRFDANIAKAEERAAKRAETTKKRKLAAAESEHPPSKRAAVAAPMAPNTPVAMPTAQISEGPGLEPEDESGELDDEHSADGGNTVPSVHGSRDDYVSERRAIYEAVTESNEPAWKKRTKKKGADRLEPAVDDLINAATRQPKKPCIRIPVMVYFGNDKTFSDHKESQPRFNDGCPRCVVKSPTICCELCSPDHFLDFARVDLPKPKQQPSRSRIPDYVRDRADCSLRDDLHAFRKQRTIEIGGRASFRNYGAGSFMSAETLDRIVDCAHFFKISSMADLLRETRWKCAVEDGERPLSLISTHKPTPPPQSAFLITSTPIRCLNTITNTPGGSTGRALRRCKISSCENLSTPRRKCGATTDSHGPADPSIHIQSSGNASADTAS